MKVHESSNIITVEEGDKFDVCFEGKSLIIEIQAGIFIISGDTEIVDIEEKEVEEV